MGVAVKPLARIAINLIVRICRERLVQLVSQLAPERHSPAREVARVRSGRREHPLVAPRRVVENRVRSQVEAVRRRGAAVDHGVRGPPGPGRLKTAAEPYRCSGPARVVTGAGGSGRGRSRRRAEPRGQRVQAAPRGDQAGLQTGDRLRGGSLLLPQRQHRLRGRQPPLQTGHLALRRRQQAANGRSAV